MGILQAKLLCQEILRPNLEFVKAREYKQVSSLKYPHADFLEGDANSLRHCNVKENDNAFPSYIS